MTARPVTTDDAARQSPHPGGAAANGAPPTQPGGPPANGAPPGRAGGPGAGHGGGPPGGPGGEKAGLRRTFSAFQYRKYRLLWISMAVGMTGMQMQMIAQGLLAYELSGTFTAVGVLAMAWGVPQFFFALPGGAIADRMDKRRILLITQVAVMAQAIVIGLAITTDVITLPILFVVGVFMGATFSFNMPARQAFIPEVVPREQMMNAIALNNTAMNATRIFSPLAAGLFISWWGFDVTYYITGAMYGVGWITVLLLPRSTAHLNRVKRGMFDEIGIGLRYVRDNPALKNPDVHGVHTDPARHSVRHDSPRVRARRPRAGRVRVQPARRAVGGGSADRLARHRGAQPSIEAAAHPELPRRGLGRGTRAARPRLGGVRLPGRARRDGPAGHLPDGLHGAQQLDADDDRLARVPTAG